MNVNAILVVNAMMNAIVDVMMNAIMNVMNAIVNDQNGIHNCIHYH